MDIAWNSPSQPTARRMAKANLDQSLSFKLTLAFLTALLLFCHFLSPDGFAVSFSLCPLDLLAVVLTFCSHPFSLLCPHFLLSRPFNHYSKCQQSCQWDAYPGRWLWYWKAPKLSKRRHWKKKSHSHTGKPPLWATALPSWRLDWVDFSKRKPPSPPFHSGKELTSPTIWKRSGKR